ncbi:hypothetical protein Tco_0937340 [Tanacetum coccineum]|uniref:Uncharacterized protein n=1 Tax=Tanacetum coccineum TaxID=301880 RepID=A0ABQ5DDZ5_9ASTR
MVACLERIEGNANFHQIVDFLNASTIRYSLTISPTIYASYIEQFWSTAKTKIVNNETQIHAKVDGKTIVISESSVRSNLHFNDEDGVTSLTNSEILENLALMGYEIVSDKLTFQKAFFSPQWKYLIHTILHCLSSKSTAWNEFSTNIASAVICLANNQKFNFSKLIFDVPQVVEGEGSGQPSEPQPPSSTAPPSQEEQVPAVATSHPQKTQTPRQAKRGQDTEIPQSGGPPEKVGDEAVHKELGDRSLGPRSHGGTIAQTRSERVPTPSYDSPLLGGGHTPGSDEGRPNINELMAICTNLSNRVLALETSKTAQDLVINKLKKKVKRLEKSANGKLRDKLLQIGTSREKLDKENNVEGDTVNAAGAVSTATTGVSAASASVTTASVSISTAELRTPPTTTTTAFEDEDLTIVQTLIKMRSEKAKVKGVNFRDVEESARSTTILPTIDPKDKGKGIMQEPEKPPRTPIKAQIQRECRDCSEPRAEQSRNKPPTRAQLRNKMVTYLKHMGKYTHNQMKSKNFEEIQKLYEREQKWINDFVPVDSEVVKDSRKGFQDHNLRVEESLDSILPSDPRCRLEFGENFASPNSIALGLWGMTSSQAIKKLVVGIKILLEVTAVKVLLVKVSTGYKSETSTADGRLKKLSKYYCLQRKLKNLLKQQYENVGLLLAQKRSRTMRLKAISPTEMHGEATIAVNNAQGVNTATLKLDNEFLQQDQSDDLEEMDLSEHAILTIRKELNLTSPRWSVSTATRDDTLQGSVGHPGIKTAEQGAYLKDLSLVEKTTVETNEPETARKENGAPIIKDWVSDSDEENVPNLMSM